MKHRKKKSNQLQVRMKHIFMCFFFVIAALQMMGSISVRAIGIEECGEYDDATDTMTLYSKSEGFKILPSEFRGLFTDEVKAKIKTLRIIEKDGRKFNVYQPYVIDHVDLTETLKGCKLLETVDLSGLEVGYGEGRGIDMRFFFSGCTSLTNVKFEGFNATRVVSTKEMFKNCTAIESLDMTSFATSDEYLYETPGMFYNCKNLKELKIPNLKTGKVTLMRGMFQKCSSLKTLDLSGFDTRSATKMYSMFEGCSKLETIQFSESFTLPNVEEAEYMFKDCKKLKAIEIHNWDTRNCINFEGMFENCGTLTKLDLSTLNTNKAPANSLQNMFLNANAVTEIKTCSTRLFLPILADAKYLWVEKENETAGYLGGSEIAKKTTLVKGSPSYQISYVVEDGTAQGGDQNFVWYLGTQNLATAASTSKHNQFDGWYFDKDYKKQVTEIAPRTIGEVTLYAKWNVEPHDMTKLSYDAKGHWYLCSICGQKENVINHVYSGKKDATCNVCDYIRAISEDGTSGNNLENRSDLPLLLVKGAQGKGDEIKLKWNKFGREKGYEIYWSYCNGKKNFKLAKSQKGTSYLHKNLEKDRSYKYFVVAYTKVKGKKVYLSKSPTIHVAMKYHDGTNIKAIKLSQKAVKLSKAQKYTIKASYTKLDKKKKVIDHCAIFRYKSGNNEVATVSKKGVVTARRRGTCTIYVSAANGVTSTIKVTVE